MPVARGRKLQQRRRRIKSRRETLAETSLASTSARLLGKGKTRGKKVYYNRYALEGEEFAVGSDVIVKAAGHDFFVARIHSIRVPLAFGLDLEPGEIEVELQWYYKLSDLSPALQKSIGSTAAHNEIFASSQRDSNSAETIEHRCRVLFGEHARRHTAQGGDDDDEGDTALSVFVCTRAVNGKATKVEPYHPLQAPDLEDDVEDNIDGAAADSSDDGEDDDREFRVSNKQLQEGLAEDDDDDDLSDDPDGDREKRHGGKRKAGGGRKSTGGRQTGTTPKRPRPSASPARSARKRQTPQLKVRVSGAPAAQVSSEVARARAKLHLAALPSSTEALPCREVEFYSIHEFVREKVQAGASGCMFVSGVPGTGKTATIRAVSRELKRELDEGELPRFQFVEINAMALTTPRQAYVELWRAISPNPEAVVSPNYAAEQLQQRFTTPSPRRFCIVVLLDEVDLLYTRKQDVLYNMFDWPTHKHSRLVLVAVANTMDLPERVLTQRVASRMGLTRQSFLPYTREQLGTILRQRVQGIECFDSPALELCSRKVAAVSGDARRALNICRRAAEMSQLAGSQRVTIKHVNEALTEMSASPMIKAMQTAAHHEQLFLLAVVSCFRKRGIEEVALEDLIGEHRRICETRGEAVPSASAVAQVCTSLGGMRILMVEPGAHDIRQKIRLNCSIDDVLFALRDDATTQALVAEQRAREEQAVAAATEGGADGGGADSADDQHYDPF